MNEPLLFINSPTYLLDDGSQNKFDSRISNKINFSPFEKQIKDLVSVYANGARILVEIKTKEKIFNGFIINYQNANISLKDEVNTYQININDMDNLNIIMIK